MNFYIMTLFPEMVMDGLNTSIIGRAVDKGLINVKAVNIRNFAFNKHNKVDDYIYGGGAGMLMQAEPVYLCYKAIVADILKLDSELININAAELDTADWEATIEKIDAVDVPEDIKLRVIYMTPQGETFKQSMAKDYSQEENLILLCGHYEGIDERVLEKIVTDNVSIGDYVLTGGELPAMIVVDTVSRLVPGVLNNEVSAEFESFQDNLLEYPQYSRPEIWRGMEVPPILMSGHHANVEKWRMEQSIIRTKERRPDLLN